MWSILYCDVRFQECDQSSFVSNNYPQLFVTWQPLANILAVQLVDSHHHWLASPKLTTSNNWWPWKKRNLLPCIRKMWQMCNHSDSTSTTSNYMDYMSVKGPTCQSQSQKAIELHTKTTLRWKQSFYGIALELILLFLWTKWLNPSVWSSASFVSRSVSICPHNINVEASSQTKTPPFLYIFLFISFVHILPI